jgi:SET domain-containing protein
MEIIKTEKKGYGLRALAPIKRNQFVIEYCGEVIPQHVFIKRAKDYAAEGVKHFYFMSLMTGEVIILLIHALDCGCSKKGKLGSFHES